MAEFPDADLGGVTELRIHGVSGTPVTSMLQHPHPVQVSGDKQAGFYRRGAADDPETPERRPDRRLEAYSWGGLTAGSGARAFWLLLLPFTLVNVASWAHPVRPATRFTPGGVVSGLIRVLALSVTGTLVLGTAVLSMDLLAWQCGADAERCASRHFFTAFLEKGRWHEPGPRIVAGAVVPLLVVAMLWWLSRSTGRAYEEYSEHIGADDVELPGTGHDSCGAADLAQPRFWSGGGPLRRLRALHTGAALATVAALLAYPARHHGGDDRRVLGTVVLTAALVVIAAALVLAATPLSGRRRELFERRRPPRWACRAMDAVQWAGLAVLAAAGVYAFTWHAPAPAELTILPGLHHAVNRLLRAQMVLWLLLLLATLWALRPYRRTASQSLRGRPMFLGLTGPVLTAMGVAVAGTYAAGVAHRFADYLGTPVPSNVLAGGGGVEHTRAILGVPPEYYWGGTAFALFVACAIVTGVTTVVWNRVHAKRRRAAVRAEYGVPSGDDERVAAIAGFEQKAALTDVGDVVLAAVLGPSLLGTVLLWTFQDRIDGHVLSALTTIGTWLVGVFALAVIGLGRSAYRNEGLRRTVGIIWDLATFWPRAAHPFAPPCYCERTVPELRRRVARLHAGGGRVVLSAHSQGTVIAAAAVLQLEPADRGRVGLVTYGSPLDRLYARAFPHYFGADSLADVAGVLGGRWRNLYRRTDPIGGPVAPPETGRDLLFTDPAFAKEEYEFTWPRARAHSDYPHDPRFAETVTAVADSLDPPPAIALPDTDPPRPRRRRTTA